MYACLYACHRYLDKNMHSVYLMKKKQTVKKGSFIFEKNIFNLGWNSCFIVGEEIWLEGFLGIFKDLQECLT